MTHRVNEVYQFLGAFLPWGPEDHFARLSSGAHTEGLKEKGFLLLEQLTPNSCIVQSLADGQVYINKWDAGTAFMPQEWRLHERCPNGGSLADLIQRHHDQGRAVPEYFIWHVIDQLSQALNYMYRNRDIYDRAPPRMQAPIFQLPQVETSLSPKPLYQNCIRPLRVAWSGPTPVGGQVRNSFPTIVISNWEDSALDGDRRPQVTAGNFGQHPVEWEDIYGFGQIVRSLMMAHVPLWNANNPCPNPGQVLNESLGWTHRPDSRVIDLNQLAQLPYSAQLQAVCVPLEIPNIQMTGVAFPGASPAVSPGGSEARAEPDAF
ncbi:kinase-like domain-containing protein [Apiospora phragmitis]|uniref:Kinase-like domain-containing protein n=1 Tax=Apiospora phragmitis TaxID=2905665 RepID=A0ABR1TW49_9PEZI